MIFRALFGDYPQLWRNTPLGHDPLIVTLWSMDRSRRLPRPAGYPPLSGQIGSVAGRLAAGGKRGSPGFEELSLHLDDGRRLASDGTRRRGARDAGARRHRARSFILARHDDDGALVEPPTIACAICFTPAETASMYRRRPWAAG